MSHTGGARDQLPPDRFAAGSDPLTEPPEPIAPSLRALAGLCGVVLTVALALTPVLGWLSSRSIATLLAVAGALTLPTIRAARRDWAVIAVLGIALAWAAVSTFWSPWRPAGPEKSTALRLLLCAPLYWSLVCAARVASPDLARLALRAFAWSCAALGVVLLAEFGLDAALYERLHVAVYRPIRHDLAEVAVAHTCFVLATLLPLAAAAAERVGITRWIAAPMAAGVAAAAWRFGAEAPVLSLAVAGAIAVTTRLWPNQGPRALAAVAVGYWLGAPLVVWALRVSGAYPAIQRRVEESWSMRMGYWGHAIDRIADHPLRGWGLEASRAFGPSIVLHPHDGALQVWLELGAAGAVLAATFWGLVISRLAAPRPASPAIAAAAASGVYLLFGALNFGVWQGWWLALGVVIAVIWRLLSTAEGR